MEIYFNYQDYNLLLELSALRGLFFFYAMFSMDRIHIRN